MGRYYCAYCNVFLEHDSHSVIRSHLQGKNHVRLYCQYYQNICLKDPKQNPCYRPNALSPPYQYILSAHYAGMPGHLAKDEKSAPKSSQMPPPPTLAKLPPPPPSHYFFDAEELRKLVNKATEDAYQHRHAQMVLPEDHHYNSKYSTSFHRGSRFGRRGGFGRQSRGGPSSSQGPRRDNYRRSRSPYQRRASPY